MNLTNIIKPDMVCILFMVASILYLYFLSGGPIKRGFFCDDQSIKYPYEPLTVGLTTILIISLVIPNIFIVMTEVNKANRLRMVKRYAFTFLSNLFLTLFFKFQVGRLRPHFWAVCQPIVDCYTPGHGLVTNSSHSEPSSGQIVDYPGGVQRLASIPRVPNINSPFTDNFVTDYNCSNTNHRQIKQLSQSFYSGHASISFSTAIWLILYLHFRYHHKSDATNRTSTSLLENRSLILPTIQLFILLIGLYPGITQINNHWHHPTDVIVGFMAGTVVSVLNFYFVN